MVAARYLRRTPPPKPETPEEAFEGLLMHVVEAIAADQYYHLRLYMRSLLTFMDEWDGWEDKGPL